MAATTKNARIYKETVFYDMFADMSPADQSVALKVMEALHRQSLRTEKQQKANSQIGPGLTVIDKPATVTQAEPGPASQEISDEDVPF